MSELLAAIPRLFTFKGRNDYAECVRHGRADRLTQRALTKTNEQLSHAFKTVVGDVEEKNDSRRSRS